MAGLSIEGTTILEASNILFRFFHVRPLKKFLKKLKSVVGA